MTPFGYALFCSVLAGTIWSILEWRSRDSIERLEPHARLGLLLLLIPIMVLAISGAWGGIKPEATLSQWPLLLHIGFGGIFLVMLAGGSVIWIRRLPREAIPGSNAKTIKRISVAGFLFLLAAFCAAVPILLAMTPLLDSEWQVPLLIVHELAAAATVGLFLPLVSMTFAHPSVQSGKE